MIWLSITYHCRCGGGQVSVSMVDLVWSQRKLSLWQLGLVDAVPFDVSSSQRKP